MSSLTANAFNLLLSRLDPDDQVSAADKYQILELKLTKYFVWQGVPESRADTLAEEAIDRLAAKLEQGHQIDSVNAYASQIARFVLLEFHRKFKETAWDDDAPEPATQPVSLEPDDERLAVLRKCLAEMEARNQDDRLLIVGYYGTEETQKNKEQRRQLAERFGLTANTLKVRACRLRLKLEKCVKNCYA